MSAGSTEKISKFQLWRKKLNQCWTPEALAQRDWRGKLKAFWRIVVTTWYGIFDNRLSQQAAGLTYFSLMSLGPILGLALTISSYWTVGGKNKSENNPAKDAVVWVFDKVVPNFDAMSQKDGAVNLKNEIIKKLNELADNLIKQAQSPQAGVIGLVIVLVLAVTMLGRVEDALNGIWGLKTGRSFRDRFTNYLLFLILFFLIGASAGSLQIVASFSKKSTDGINSFFASGPVVKVLGFFNWTAEGAVNFFNGFAPHLIIIALFTLSFAVFNRLMPNIRIRWSAAFIGGFATALLIYLNNHLASIYISKVIELNDLYGQLSIVPILMFGSYLIWLFVLIGGQLAYAFQNRWALARHKAWEHFSHRARRTLAFIAVAETLRRFNQGQPGPTAEDIAESAHVPTMVVDDCLQMLRSANILVAESYTYRHKPSRPLDAMTVGELWSLVDLHTSNVAGEPNLTADPAGRTILAIEKNLLQTADSKLTLGELASRT